MKKFLLTGFAVTSFVAAQAQIVSTSGDAVDVSGAPPSSVVPNFAGSESDTDAIAFFESTTTLGADLSVNAAVAGTTYTTSVGSTILAGTEVSSFFIHTDKVGASSGVVDYNGEVTFSHRILGVIATGAQHDASDSILGRAGTTYGTGTNDRQWEFASTEFYTISNDGMSIRFSNRLNTSADQLRVVTEGVPEPTTMAIFGLGAAALAARKKRKA